ncbi:MAG: hypothetical protein ACOC3T_02390 [Bacteroidota bacterium]
MENLNYFELLCYFWALLGIISRILMVSLGNKWNKWELKSAYSEKKPVWVYLVIAVGYFLIGFSWYKVINSDVAHAWIIALLVSLTGIKISALLFRYDQFRVFAKKTLTSRAKLIRLNISVFVFSMVLVGMGMFLY